MKKFAALLMLVCSLGVFAVVGCGPDAKPTTPAPKADAPKTDDKGGKMENTTPPVTPAPADKDKK